MSAHGDVDLGHTLAGWTGTALAMLGSLTLGAAMCLHLTWATLLGAALTAAAALVTWVLHLAGWGKPSGPRPAAEWDWRVRDTAARGGHTNCLGCRLAGRGGHAGHERAAGDVALPSSPSSPVSGASPMSSMSSSSSR
ncbi:HGxxPAAW family protein [Streptomyces sp. NPDC001941]|uniref:HGxxPAAW family protein n=1 Tax=Streptomyces sp. NPDC001941 TaxID=3154659 RepID=UPI003321F85B